MDAKEVLGRIGRNTLRFLVRNPVAKIFCAIFLFVVISANIVLFFEGANPGANIISNPEDSYFKQFGESMWWAVVTMTTVGYGDKYPTSSGGRVIAVILMFSSLVLIALFTATISSMLVENRFRKGKGLDITKVKNHIVLCGWNDDTPRVLQMLASDRTPRSVVLVNEMAPEAIEGHLAAYGHLDTHFVRGDFSQEAVLVRANVQHAAAVLILPDTSGPNAQPDERTLSTLLLVKSMRSDVKVYAHIKDRSNLVNLRRANVDDVVVSDAHAAELMADMALAPGVPQALDQLIDADGENRLLRVEIPEAFIGRTSGELFDHLKRERNWILVGYAILEAGFGLSDAIQGGSGYITDFIHDQIRSAGISTATEEHLAVKINPENDYVIGTDHAALVIGRKEQ